MACVRSVLRSTTPAAGAIVHHRASQYVAKLLDEVAPVGYLRRERNGKPDTSKERPPEYRGTNKAGYGSKEEVEAREES